MKFVVQQLNGGGWDSATPFGFTFRLPVLLYSEDPKNSVTFLILC